MEKPSRMENLELTIGSNHTSLEAYTELLFRLLFQAPIKSDAVFIHANQDSEGMHAMVKKAVELFQQGFTSCLVLNGLQLTEVKERNITYEGFAYWKDVLMTEHRVPESAIVAAAPGYHTPAESLSVLALAKEHHWKRVTLFAVPAQLMRAYLQMVAFLNDQPNPLLVHFQTTHIALNWDSQLIKYLMGGGTLKGTRGYHAQEEVKRLALYMRGCDPKFTHHATIEEGLAYLKKHF